MAYATPDELAEHLLPDPPPANPERLLARASRDVNQAIATAVYDVDSDTGQPVAEKIRVALRDATLEQATYRLDTGDGGGAGQWEEVSLLSAKLKRRTDRTPASENAVGQLGADAWNILFDAGLTGHGPWAC